MMLESDQPACAVFDFMFFYLLSETHLDVRFDVIRGNLKCSFVRLPCLKPGELTIKWLKESSLSYQRSFTVRVFDYHIYFCLPTPDFGVVERDSSF